MALGSGEVEASRGALDAEKSSVVGPGGGLRRGVRAQPDPGLVVGNPDLGDPRSPASHPHALVASHPVALSRWTRAAYGGLVSTP